MDTVEDESLGLVNLEALKNTLREQLQKSGINNLIRHVVRDVCITNRKGMKKLNSDEVIQEIYNRGLMKDVLDSFKSSAVPKETATRTKKSKLKRAPDIDIEEKSSHAVVKIVSDPNKNSVQAGERDVEKDGTDQDEDDEYEDDFLSEPRESKPSQSSRNSDKLIDLDQDEDDQVSEADVISVVSEIIQSEHEMIKMSTTHGPMNGKYYLKLEILGGQAFLEHLFEYNGVSRPQSSINNGIPHADANSAHKSKFVLHIFFKSERFRSKSVECRCEPVFQDTFMLSIGYFENGSILQLLALNEEIRFVLVREDAHGGSIVVSHRFYDWRPILKSGTCTHKVSLELMGIGPEHKVPIGILNLRISILPTLQEQLSDSTYWAQICVEKTKQDEKDRLFLVYTKQWGREYMDIRPENQKRLVKLFSYDENTVSRPVHHFVGVLVADRLLATPYHAAWFVSMLSIRDDAENLLQMKSSVAPRNPGRQDARHILSDHWQSLQSTIASKSGSVEDHAVLLCSLLLGFGLEAYVSIGTKLGSEAWVWVVTFDMEFVPTFWESVMGKSFQHHPRPAGELPDERVYRLRQNELHKFKTIDCIFNNKSFLANVQPNNLIETTEWNLNNPAKWKRIPECTIQPFRLNNYPITLYPSTVNPTVISADLEIQLKILLSDTRRHKGLHTKWDEHLSSLLGQELARYELEASTGARQIPGHFETSVMKLIPNGYDFKGFPYHCVINDPKKIYYECLREKECKDIVCCRGLGVNHALRVDSFPYPEGITSIRIMFACKYMSVS